MIRLLQSQWGASVVGTVLYLLTTVLLWHPAKHHAVATQPATTTTEALPSWNYHNPDVEQFISELKKEKMTLAEREKQLNEFAARLDAERQEINQVTQSVHRLQLEFDSNVVRVREEESANLKKLAKIYAAMDPDTAAPILRELPDDALVKILIFLKDSETAPLLEAMSKGDATAAKRVALLSERLRLSLPVSVKRTP